MPIPSLVPTSPERARSGPSSPPARYLPGLDGRASLLTVFRRPLFASAVGVLASIGIAACNPFESRHVKACEAALKDTLRSPSTYQQIRVTERTETIPIEKYLADEKNEAVRQVYLRQYKQAVRSLVYFEFDAANAYGTPIRGFSEYSYDTIDGDISRVSELMVKIDGKTKTDRLVDAVRQLQAQ
jgi:hypothetical protein